MYNPVDTGQIRAMVDSRREQLATDAYRQSQAIDEGRAKTPRGQRVRFAIGAGLMRAGARISGTGVQDLTRLRPGV